jgi:thioesterase domain-containing protein
VTTDASLDGLIVDQARRAPDAVAVEDEHETLTYREHGWWALARDGVVEIPLDAAHIAMLREPAVAQAAAALQQAIDAALGREHALV